MEINKTVTGLVDALSKQILAEVTTKTSQIIIDTITAHVNAVNFDKLMAAALKNHLKQQISNYDFPERSIKSSSIDYVDTFSGDSIRGGIIKEFGSTGIDDKATACRVTILDDHTVVENNLLTQDLTVKGSATIEGDTRFAGGLYIEGTIDESSPGFRAMVQASAEEVKTQLNTALFDQYSNLVQEKIKQEGIDLTKLTFNGQAIVDGTTLAGGIVDSNLKTVGVLTELQVSGESLIYNTLFVNNRRIGVNTLEPSAAVSIWDEEVDIHIGKRQQGIMSIGSNREQSLALVTNGKLNLMLNTDGSITTQKINLGAMTFSSAGSPPAYDAQKGTVVFNSNPSVGGPLGWVSLGQARWANFGIIE